MAARLAGKTALITGSTKGIGLGLARAFVEEGARVVVNSRSAEDCAREARTLGPAALPIAADLSRSDEVRRLARDAAAAFDGAPDILVNNAGQPRVAPSEALPEADYRQTLELNLTAYFLLSQEVARGMLARGSGSIVNVSSMFGSVPAPERLPTACPRPGST
jgi:NAD(P)-dependent dehydrogenase (short-subunit alcohol dehydrogenase family)